MEKHDTGSTDHSHHSFFSHCSVLKKIFIGAVIFSVPMLYFMKRINTKIASIDQRLLQISRQGRKYSEDSNTNIAEVSHKSKTEGASTDFPVDLSKASHPIYRICLTGGPCAGKTTVLTTLMPFLEENGFKVLLVPEAPTMMSKAGCFINIHKMSFSQLIKFQISLIKMQMAHENIFLEIAMNANQPSVLIMDRGVMDVQAYVQHDIWKAILNETGWTTIQLRDKRYDAVCHMTTAADGAEEFYSLDNNARYETPAQAREVDRKLIKAYTGHPHYRIVDNSSPNGFKGKVKSVVDFVSLEVGLPDLSNRKTIKYLLDVDGSQFLFDAPEDLGVETFEIEEMFLTCTDSNVLENKITSRGKGDTFIYSHSILMKINNELVKKKSQISAREYVELSESKDTNKKLMQKVNHCFIYNKHAFTICSFKNLKKPLYTMVVRADADSKVFEVPPFIKVAKDISHDEFYYTHKLADMDHEYNQ